MLVRSARYYFPTGSAAELLALFRPQMTPGTEELYLSQSFLAHFLPTEDLDALSSWLPSAMGTWASVQHMPAWDTQWLLFMTRYAPQHKRAHKDMRRRTSCLTYNLAQGPYVNGVCARTSPALRPTMWAACCGRPTWASSTRSSCSSSACRSGPTTPRPFIGTRCRSRAVHSSSPWCAERARAPPP